MVVKQLKRALHWFGGGKSRGQDPPPAAKPVGVTTSGAVNVSETSLQIPGGLAGIRQRMAEMGHGVNLDSRPQEEDPTAGRSAETWPHGERKASRRRVRVKKQRAEVKTDDQQREKLLLTAPEPFPMETLGPSLDFALDGM